MFQMQVEYEDFNGKTQKQVVMFNLSKEDVLRLEASREGGLEGVVKDYNEKPGNPEAATAMVEMFSDIIKMGYGVKSDDGQFFEKNEVHSARFMQSACYDETLALLLTDTELSTKFFNRLIKGNRKTPEKAVVSRK